MSERRTTNMTKDGRSASGLQFSILFDVLSFCCSSSLDLTWWVQIQAPLCFLHCRGHSVVYQAHLIAPAQTSFLKAMYKYCLNCGPIMGQCMKLDWNRCHNTRRHEREPTSLHGKMRFVISWGQLMLKPSRAAWTWNLKLTWYFVSFELCFFLNKMQMSKVSK